MSKINLVIALATVFLWSCTPSERKDEAKEEKMEETTKMDSTAMSTDSSSMKMAIATIKEANKSMVSGTVKFTQVDSQKVKIEVEVMNLAAGEHALHLHEKGDCSAPDAKSAGGHWNPTGEKHGKRGSGEYHKGDITNLKTEKTNSMTFWSETISGWTIGGPDSTNIVGKAVIIHDGADDFTSQPSGAAGKRVACGVIEMK